MPWLKRVAVKGHWTAKDFDVDLTAEGRDKALHLILTGPNGAGKTTILDWLGKRMLANPSNPRWGRHGLTLEWTTGLQSAVAAFKGGKLAALYLPARRDLSMQQPQGPIKVAYPTAQPTDYRAPQFLQYLVNEQVQARLADLDIPEEKAEQEAILRWFENLEAGLAELFDSPGLALRFDRKKYDISIERPGKPSISFNQLPAGHASAVTILAELILRIDASTVGLARDADELSGVVAIDELSLHLHPAMQERILPFLTRAFPRLQFIIATHSPAIICSVPDAMVVDLGSGRIVPSHELQGTPYGELMRTHFGIETDIDLDSTRKLKRLEELDQNPERTPEEDVELETLADTLTRTSHPLALQVWNRVTARRLREAARAEAAR